MKQPSSVLRYFTKLPDGQEREWDLPALFAARCEGVIAGHILVRSEHQDFWYPVAELLGDNSTRPLLFPCHQCQHMIHSRRIDIGNPIECPACHATHVVPDVRRRKRLPGRANPFQAARSRVILGVLLLLVGIVPVAYWFFHPKPGYNADRYPLLFTVLVYVGLALVILNWRTFRRGKGMARR